MATLHELDLEPGTRIRRSYWADGVFYEVTEDGDYCRFGRPGYLQDDGDEFQLYEAVATDWEVMSVKDREDILSPKEELRLVLNQLAQILNKL